MFFGSKQKFSRSYYICKIYLSISIGKFVHFKHARIELGQSLTAIYCTNTVISLRPTPVWIKVPITTQGSKLARTHPSARKFISSMPKVGGFIRYSGFPNHLSVHLTMVGGFIWCSSFPNHFRTHNTSKRIFTDAFTPLNSLNDLRTPSNIH